MILDNEKLWRWIENYPKTLDYDKLNQMILLLFKGLIVSVFSLSSTIINALMLTFFWSYTILPELTGIVSVMFREIFFTEILLLAIIHSCIAIYILSKYLIVDANKK